MNPFTILAGPLGALLAFFYEVIPNYGIAIILLTLSVNLLLFPLTLKQTRSMKAMQELQPEIKRLQKEHKGDREALNKAMMELYQERGVNPVAGCLPLILQLPIWFALFRVLQSGTGIPEDSSLATAIANDETGFLGLDLQVSPNDIFSAEGLVAAIPYMILVAIVTISGFYQQRQLTRQRGSDAPAPDTQQGVQNALKFMPVIFGVISWLWPTGLVLYFATSNLFRIGQQAVIFRLDGGDGGGVNSKPEKPKPDGSEGDAGDAGERSGPSPHTSKKRRQRRRK